MSDLDDLISRARALDGHGRQTLLAALAGPSPTQLSAMASRPPSPHSVAWVKSERGHAVLATDTGPAESDLPIGPDAIAGMWADMTAPGDPS